MKRTSILVAVVAAVTLTATLTLAVTLPGFAHGFACGFRATSGLPWLDAYRAAETAIDRLEWLESLDS